MVQFATVTSVGRLSNLGGVALFDAVCPCAAPGPLVKLVNVNTEDKGSSYRLQNGDSGFGSER